MRRWDVWLGLAGFSISVLDLFLFATAGLEIARLTRSFGGWIILAGFIVGYTLVGFLSGRVWMARGRAQQDSVLIADQLRALEESRARIAQSEKLAALGGLAAGIAHEVRNPLGVIRASAGLLQESFDQTTDEYRACEMVQDEIDRLDGLIGSLLAYAKPAAMDLCTTSVSDVLHAATRLAQEIHPQFAITTEIACSKSIRADPDLLTQVILGLLINAREAGARRAEVSANREAEHVLIDVVDDGPGIPPEVAGRVFEPFFTTKAQGTGLGLAIAARIVQAHGGEITVNTSGRGGSFRLRLPCDGPATVPEAA